MPADDAPLTKRARWILANVGLALWFGAGPAEAGLKVVATLPDLAAIAREIGGDRIELTTLAKPTEDPHFVDAKPSFVVKLNRADVLVEGGAELEAGWLPPLLNRARNPNIAPGAPGHLRASDGVNLLEIPTALDRSQGDIHAAGNPHYLIDPVNAGIVAAHLADRFARLDSAGAEAYRGQLRGFTQRLEAKRAAWQARLGPFRGVRLVAYHNSWPYFAQRFGLKIDLFLEPKPGIPPAPAHLAAVVSAMQASKVRVILVDAYVSRRTADTVARDTGAVVVPVTQFPGGVKGTEEGYLALLDYLVDALARALGPGSSP